MKERATIAQREEEEKKKKKKKKKKKRDIRSIKWICEYYFVELSERLLI